MRREGWMFMCSLRSFSLSERHGVFFLTASRNPLIMAEMVSGYDVNDGEGRDHCVHEPVWRRHNFDFQSKEYFSCDLFPVWSISMTFALVCHKFMLCLWCSSCAWRLRLYDFIWWWVSHPTKLFRFKDESCDVHVCVATLHINEGRSFCCSFGNHQ